ncbi:enterobactin transporter EntS [Kineococcus glutinatus]|uniref:Enterobactin transporter EntS n=1 Tax=Kineococcus glutinatus TaxID=1070872 RepID=A0ABP9I5T6_9ACTN
MRLADLAIDVRPLRESRAFRRVFWARTVSVFGLGMLSLALTDHVTELTGSPLHVAAVNAVLGVASFAGLLAGGVVADRFDRRPVIAVSRAVATLGFAVLVVNALAPQPDLAVFYVVAVVDGLAGGFSTTALAAAVPALVGEERLAAAGALMALTLDLGTVLSPLLAGALIEGPGWWTTYAAAAAASAVTVALVWSAGPMPPGAGEEDEEEAGPWRSFTGGLRFALRERVVAAVLLLGFVQILFASPYVLLPFFVADELAADARVFGYLVSATAAGALLGSLTSGWTGRVRRAGLALVAVLCAGAAGVAVLGLSRSVAAAVAVMVVVGYADVIGEILRYAVLAHHTPDRLRGRVSSLWSAQATTGDALGGLALGGAARAVGPGPAIVAGGVAALAATVLVALACPALVRARVRPGGDAAGDDAADVPNPLPAHVPGRTLEENA